MNEVIEKVKQELLIRCEKSKQKDGYDFWNEHIKYVVQNAVKLAKEYGEREQHHIFGAEIAEQLLTELEYPKERIEQVKNCVLNHRGSKDKPRNTIEEQCVADADVIAH
ncbi:MAG: HD domain-containing protein [Clostridia bacterium]|nr:HD domain-containing protein [Clostridia bacterium]